MSSESSPLIFRSSLEFRERPFVIQLPPRSGLFIQQTNILTLNKPVLTVIPLGVQFRDWLQGKTADLFGVSGKPRR